VKVLQSSNYWVSGFSVRPSAEGKLDMFSNQNRPHPLLFLALCVALSTVAVPALAASRLRVVTTVAPLTDLVRQIGGDAISLHGLVPAGVNSHTFQPAPGDVQHLVQANLIVLNGLHLEVPIEKLARSSGKPGVAILKLGDHTIDRGEWVFDASFPEIQGHPNPHLWLNVAYAIIYTRLIRDQLIALDPDHQTVYHQHAADYVARLRQLDRCIATAIATIPSAQRTLLTYHDSWPYFARRYGMRVLGALQPANFFEPSPREVARMIDQIRQAKIQAIFGSRVFPSKVLEKIAAETEVRYVTALRDDVLPGQPGESGHSYIGMMLENVGTMVTALGGEAALLVPCTASLLHEAK
jgi:zinc/manganese transport system substrate-binding protein